MGRKKELSPKTLRFLLDDFLTENIFLFESAYVPILVLEMLVLDVEFCTLSNSVSFRWICLVEHDIS